MLRKDSKEQLRAHDNKTPSLLKTILGTGAAFLAWGIGLKVAKGVSHLINRKAGVAIANWAYNNNSKLHNFITNVFKRTSAYIRESGLAKDRVQELKTRLARTTKYYGKLRKETRIAIQNIKEKYSEATAGFEHTRYFVPKAAKLISSVENKIPVRYYKQIAEKDIRATSIFWNTRYARSHNIFGKIAKIRASKALLPGGDYFAPATHPKYRLGGSKFGEAFQARVYRYMTSLLATAPVEYTVTRMMDTQHDDKWYSPRAVGSWLKWNISADLTMGFIPGRVMSAIGKRAKGMMQLKGKKGINFLHKVLGTAEKISRSAFVTSLYETSNYVKYLNKTHKRNTLGTTIEWMRKAVHSFRSNYIKNANLSMKRRTTAAQKMEREAISFLKMVDKNRSDGKNITADTMMRYLTIHHMVEDNLSKDDPNKWLHKISWIFDNLKTKPSGAKSKRLSNVLNSIGYFIEKGEDPFSKNQIVYAIRKAEGNISNVSNRIAYGGISSIFTDRDKYNTLKKIYTPHKGVISFDNRVYDLSNIMPQRFFKNIYNILSGVSIFGLHPFKLLGYGPLLNVEDKFTVKRYKAGDVVKVGPMIDPHRLNKLEDFVNETIDNASNNTKGRIRYRIMDKIYKEIKNDAKKKLSSIGLDGATTIDAMLDRSGVAAQEAAARTMFRKRIANKDLSSLNVKSVVDKLTETKYQLASGRVKLVSGEEVWYIGKQLYYVPDINTRNMKIYQIGLDWKTRKYPLIDLISKENVGSLGVVDDIYGGSQPYVKTIVDGKYQRVKTGIGTKSPQSKVKPNDSFIMKQIHKAMDWLDLGTYEHPSLFNELGHFVRRFTMAKEPRKYFSDEYVFNEQLKDHVTKVADSTAKRTFVKLTKNHIRKMQEYALDKIFNSEAAISALNKIGNKRYSRLVKSNKKVLPFNTDELYHYLDTNNLTYLVSTMRASMDRNFDVLPNGSKKTWKAFSKYLTKEEFNFINLLSNNSPIDVVSQLSVTNSLDAGINFVKKFHNIRSKILLASLSDSELSYVTQNISQKLSTSSFKKLTNAFDLVKIMNKNIDDENIFDIILTNKNVHELMSNRLDKYFTIVKDNRHVFEAYAKYSDPIWKMKGSPNVRLYGGGGAVGDLFLSTNKTASGEYVRSFWDSFLPKTIRTDEGWDVPDGMLTKTGALTMAAVHAVNNTAAYVGLDFNLENMRTPTMFMRNLIFKRVVPALGLAAAWKMADAFVDYFPLFDGTSLQNGLNSFMADQIATARLSIARINDITGITDSARYLENLLPGSINSPLAGAVRGFGLPLLGSALGATKGGPKGGLLGGAIGLSLSILTAGGPISFITGDWLTKRREDIIEEYAGRKLIPHHRQSGWLVSSSPFAGTGIDAFLPSWYTRIHSDYKHTDVLYGSKFEELISVFDPNHYFEKHKYTRPYPFSGGFLENVPLIGNIVSFGGEYGDYPEMQMSSAIDNGDVSYSPNMETLGMMSGYSNTTSSTSINPTLGLTGNPTTLYYNGVKPMAPTSLPAKIQSTFYGGTELLGLRGFLTQTAVTEFNNDMFPFEDIPVFQSAKLMTSPTRQYWDNMPSDPLALGEMVRRFVPRRGEHVNEWSNLINAMPQWLPTKFKTGDPFIKLRLGEARLPGPGLEAWRNIKFTIPLEAEYMGLSPEEQLKYMTGNHMPVDPNERFTKLLGGKVAKQVADTLYNMNTNVKINQYVFNPFLNASGKFDVVVNNRSGMKVKVVTPEIFNRLTAPRPQDVGEMNALLNIGRSIKTGTIIYVNVQTGDTKEFQVNADPNAFQRELQRTNMVRSVALNIINEHKDKIGKAGLGYAYSRVDRLVTLADVAPNSPEYRETLKEVNELDKMNMLTPEDRQKVYVAITQVARKRDQFKYTEKKFTRGKPATEQEEIYQQAIKHEYGLVERTVGSLWENLTFRDSIITSRFVNNVTPIDVYRKYYVYGDGPVRQWQHPYSDFIRPYGLSALNRDKITDSVSSMATAGYVFGGPVGAGFGAIAGASWWFLHGKEQVPEFTRRRAQLLKQLDTVQYIKAQEDMQMGDVSAKWRMMNTMTYTFNNNASVEQMIQSLPRTEREFVKHFADASTMEERERIMNLVPDYARYVLNKAWSTGTRAYIDKRHIENMDNPITSTDLPSPFWAGFDPAVKTSDIKVKILENEGYNAKTVGIGFQAQKREMLRNPLIPQSFNEPMRSISFPDTEAINRIVKSVFPGAQISVLPTQLPGIKLIVKGNFISKSYKDNYIKSNYGG